MNIIKIELPIKKRIRETDSVSVDMLDEMRKLIDGYKLCYNNIKEIEKTRNRKNGKLCMPIEVTGKTKCIAVCQVKKENEKTLKDMLKEKKVTERTDDCAEYDDDVKAAVINVEKTIDENIKLKEELK